MMQRFEGQPATTLPPHGRRQRAGRPASGMQDTAEWNDNQTKQILNSSLLLPLFQILSCFNFCRYIIFEMHNKNYVFRKVKKPYNLGWREYYLSSYVLCFRYNFRSYKQQQLQTQSGQRSAHPLYIKFRGPPKRNLLREGFLLYKDLFSSSRSVQGIS